MTSFFFPQNEGDPDRTITPASYLGVFLRKVALQVRQLSFHHVVELVERLRSWLQDVDTKDPPADEQIALETLHGFHASRVDQLYGSPHPKMAAALKEHGQKADSDVEQSYSLFLAAWRRGDYSTALENLSRYFDYAVGDAGRSSYQYALLNLALLQADFGCLKEALWAIHETIDAARDAKDDVCLSFALSWLSSLADTGQLKDEPGLLAIKADEHVIRRAHETRLPKIEAAAYLARSTANSGGRSYVNLLQSLRATLDADHNPGMDQLLAMSRLWLDLDVPSLADMALSLACTLHPPDDSAVHARLLCAMARRLRTLGKLEEADEWMRAEKYALVNHAYHRILSVQAAQFRVARCDAACEVPSADDLCMEDLAIQEDSLAVAPRVRRAIRNEDAASAWTLLHALSQARQTPQAKALYLQLKGELWFASAEPERAIVPFSSLLRHCLEHALIYKFRHEALPSFLAAQHYLENHCGM